MKYPVRMIHPEHGMDHAYSEVEVKAFQAKGWAMEGGLQEEVNNIIHAEPQVPSEPIEGAAKFGSIDMDEHNARQEAKRKPGRPPKAK